METLPDYLRPGLDIVSIGLNPSLYSVERGFYFARPQNRFWKALNGSHLLPEELTPGAAAVEKMFADYGIGFTDVVKRPSRGAADLKPADFREWAPILRDKLLHNAPRIAWFHGKLAYGNYLQFAEQVRGPVEFGLQARPIGGSQVFVTPNPSPANASFSLEDLVAWYGRLRDLRLDQG